MSNEGPLLPTVCQQIEIIMDHGTEISQRLKQYVATLSDASAKVADDSALEQWLGFWDEDDAVYGNVRNLEHWLSQELRSRRFRRNV